MRKSLWLLCVLCVLFVLMSCGQKKKEGKQELEPPTTIPQPSTPQTPAPAPIPGAPDVFIDFCTKSPSIDTIKKDLSDVLIKLCDSNGIPTSLLKSELLTKVYNGSGELSLTEVIPVSSNGPLTSGLFGAAIMLPVDLDTYVQDVVSKDDTKEVAELVAKASGTTLTGFEALNQLGVDGYRTHGFSLHITTKQRVIIIDVVTENVVRYEYFKLSDNLVVMTRISEQGIQVLKDYKVLAIVVRMTDSSYMINLVQIVAENKGIPSAAERLVKSQVKAQTKVAYDRGKK